VGAAVGKPSVGDMVGAAVGALVGEGVGSDVGADVGRAVVGGLGSSFTVLQIICVFWFGLQDVVAEL